MATSDSFVYCWTDHKTNKLYVGVHKGTLDDGYVCSSRHFMKEYKTRPSDFTRQIIANGINEDMRVFESKILQAANAGKEDSFYNMHENNGKFYWKGARGKFSEEHKEKLRLAKLGIKQSKETIAKRVSKNIGKKRSIETCQKIGDAHRGKTISKEHKEKMRQNRLDNPNKTEWAKKAGKASQEKRKNNPNYSQKQSERMKFWWNKRKGIIT